MGNISLCLKSYRIETMNSRGQLVVNTTEQNPNDACITVLDLGSLNIRAKGFRRGFVNYPYGYLSAGHYSLVARLDFEHFSLNTTKLVDLSLVDKTYGGYSGGFADGTWACFKYVFLYYNCCCCYCDCNICYFLW
jgi:hypothetical protein